MNYFLSKSWCLIGTPFKFFWSPPKTPPEYALMPQSNQTPMFYSKYHPFSNCDPSKKPKPRRLSSVATCHSKKFPAAHYHSFNTIQKKISEKMWWPVTEDGDLSDRISAISWVSWPTDQVCGWRGLTPSKIISEATWLTWVRQKIYPQWKVFSILSKCVPCLLTHFPHTGPPFREHKSCSQIHQKS